MAELARQVNAMLDSGAAPSAPSGSSGGPDLGPDLTIFGPKFASEWERQLGTTVDGVISGQTSADAAYFWAVQAGTVQIDGGSGSQVVTAMQRKLVAAGYTCGAKGADGCYGPSTISAHQRWLIDHGYPVGASGADGHHGHDTNRAMAKALAAGAYRKL